MLKFRNNRYQRIANLKADTTARHGTARHGTARRSAAQHGATQHSTAQHSTAHAAQRNAAQHSAAQHCRAQRMRHTVRTARNKIQHKVYNRTKGNVRKTNLIRTDRLSVAI